MRTPSIAGVLVAFAASALPAQQADTAAPPPPPRPPKSSSTLITAEDIERAGSSVGNGYDAVLLLRPNWLKQRNAVLNLPGATAPNTGTPDFSVFVEGHNQEMGGLSYLRSVPAEQIYTLRFLSMNEVGVRYGPTNGPGIVVTFVRH